MFWVVLVCSVMIVRGEVAGMENRYVEEEMEEESVEETADPAERSWKMSKRGIGYLVVAMVLKALFWIKLALGKLAILGNISVILSKLSLILSLLFTFGKYFSGLGKMLRVKEYDGHGSYHHHPARTLPDAIDFKKGVCSHIIHQARSDESRRS
ncbi:UNVERIFIED_CONTAM: hypothetical protein PYX00_004771 [Menopon gallinae]|uniref:Uncharacterized protein n=1 Tax=Menopon gallinae TaxID=328185 RepID=A0AAW2I570_9NEOP